MEMAMAAMVKSKDKFPGRHSNGEPPEATPAGNRRKRETHQMQQHESDSVSAPAPKRSSRFRGVSRHRWTGRYEAHLWDKLSWNVTQKKKGKQVYLGAYDEEEAAARAYDLAALKYWGTSTFTNFPMTNYENEIRIMQTVAKEEYLASLRRKSRGFSKGVSKYRGVARHHHNVRWEARIGRVFGNKYLYLGTYSIQEEAARAYDIAAIEYRGINAVTNFDLSSYIRWLRPGSGTSPALTQETRPKAESEEVLLSSESGKGCLNQCRTYGTKAPLNYSSKSTQSPTALGLLLKSSAFRELLEKNSHLSEEESDDENSLSPRPKSSGCNEYGVVFHDAPSVFASSGLENELQRWPHSFYDCSEIMDGSNTDINDFFIDKNLI